MILNDDHSCDEDYCYRDTLGVFRTGSVECFGESVSYGEISVVVCDWWCVRLPRCGELEDDAWPFVHPRRNVRHVVQGYIVQFDP